MKSVYFCLFIIYRFIYTKFLSIFTLTKHTLILKKKSRDLHWKTLTRPIYSKSRQEQFTKKVLTILKVDELGFKEVKGRIKV